MSKLLNSAKKHVHEILSFVLASLVIGTVGVCFAVAAPVAVFLLVTIPLTVGFMAHDFIHHSIETFRHHVKVGIFATIVIGLLAISTFATPVSLGLFIGVTAGTGALILLYEVIREHYQFRTTVPFIAYVALVILLAVHIALIPLVLVVLLGGVLTILFRHAWDEVLKARVRIEELERQIARKL